MYLDGFYNRVCVDHTSRFVGDLLGHMHFVDVCSEINDMCELTDNMNENIDNIVSTLYDNMSKPKQVNRSRLFKNVLSVNTTQYDRLNSGSIHYIVPERTQPGGCDDKSGEWKATEPTLTTYSLDKRLSRVDGLDIHDRNIVLYVRGYSDNNTDEFGCDMLQMLILYKVLKRLVLENRFELFTGVKLVSRHSEYPHMLEQHVDTEDLLRVYDDQFIITTSVFANTIHFYGGELPEAYMYNIPLLGCMYDLQDYTSALPNKHVIRMLQYCGKCVDGYLVPDTDAEYVINNQFYSWSDILTAHDLKYDNNTLHGLIQTTVEGLLYVENELLHDNINEGV